MPRKASAMPALWGKEMFSLSTRIAMREVMIGLKASMKVASILVELASPFRNNPIWRVIPKKEKTPICKKSFSLRFLKSMKRTAKTAAMKKRPKARLNGGIISRFIFIKGRVAPQDKAVVVRAITPKLRGFIQSIFWNFQLLQFLIP